jgi:hypothetical protein
MNPQDSSNNPQMPKLNGDEAIFSQPQLDWVVQQTKDTAERAASAAASRVRNRALVGFIILLLGLLVVGYTVQVESDKSRAQIVKSGDAIAVGSCNRDYTVIDSLRDELERSFARIDSLEADGTYSKHQADVARESTGHFLEKYKLPDCRSAETILTDDPEAEVTVPVPRYPDDPQQLRSEAAEEEGQ